MREKRIITYIVNMLEEYFSYDDRVQRIEEYLSNRSLGREERRIYTKVLEQIKH